MTVVGVAVVLLLLLSVQGTSSLFYQSRRQQRQRQCLPGVSQSQLANITVTMADMSRFYSDILPQILVPRLPGTPSHSLVRQFIDIKMREAGWSVKFDEFSESTPFGPRVFTNIVATLKPLATKRIVFACHYESKYMQNGVFLGATDSAVPCSILLDSAWKLKDLLNTRQDITPQFIFFDGEESFVRWTVNDSLYGSRHLAWKWQNEPDPNDELAADNLENIEFFVLLDLIGGSNLRFVDFYSNTSNYFYSLYQIEHCLRTERILPYRHYQHFLFDMWPGRISTVEDDHIPFIQKGVPVLHLISTPFPDVWHTLNDDLEHLDRSIISQFSSIFRMFLFRVFNDANY